MKKLLSVNTQSQKIRLLEYLRANQHGATTLELVKELDILRPGARICELREEGYKIITHFDVVTTAHAVHRNARYVLLA